MRTKDCVGDSSDHDDDRVSGVLQLESVPLSGGHQQSMLLIVVVNWVGASLAHMPEVTSSR